MSLLSGPIRGFLSPSIVRPVLVAAPVAVRAHCAFWCGVCLSVTLRRLRVAELVDVVLGAAARVSKIAHMRLLAT
jgi:hypothetical protein